MSNGVNLTGLFFIILFFSILVVLFYYWGMKRNRDLSVKGAETLENIFNPTDKEYVWVGGAIGFNFQFTLEDKKDLKGILLLLPRQSFFYYPVSLLTSRFDRFYLSFPYFIPSRELHIFSDKNIFYLKKPSEERFSTISPYRIDGLKFKIYSNSGKGVEFAENFLQNFPNKGDLYQLSSVPQKGSILLIRYNITRFRENLKFINSFFKIKK